MWHSRASLPKCGCPWTRRGELAVSCGLLYPVAVLPLRCRASQTLKRLPPAAALPCVPRRCCGSHRCPASARPLCAGPPPSRPAALGAHASRSSPSNTGAVLQPRRTSQTLRILGQQKAHRRDSAAGSPPNEPQICDSLRLHGQQGHSTSV